MGSPVAVEDLARRWRPLDTTETELASAYLDDAWEELLLQVPDIEARLDDGTLRPGLVISKVVAVVKSVMLNPEGYVQESLDDWSGRRDSSAGRISFSEADLASLRGTVSRARSAWLV